MKTHKFINLTAMFLFLGMTLSLLNSIENTSKTHSIKIEGMKFIPNTIVVEKGDSITFTNKSNMIHNVVIQDLSINSKFIKKDESITIKITKKGKFNFYCMPHKAMGMTGSITSK
jgi:plastocyanin